MAVLTTAPAASSPSSPSSESAKWPTFDEMASSILTSSSSSAAPDHADVVVNDAPAAANVLEPEMSMMDYAWNEDNIQIDFMTGERHFKSIKRGLLESS